MMTKFRKRLQGSAGFTLVELIVVIAVLGILAGIAIPRITGVRDKAEISAVKSDLRNIQSGLEMYFAETGNTTLSAVSDVEDYIGANINVSKYITDVTTVTTDYSITYVVEGVTVELTPGGVSEQ